MSRGHRPAHRVRKSVPVGGICQRPSAADSERRRASRAELQGRTQRTARRPQGRTPELAPGRGARNPCGLARQRRRAARKTGACTNHCRLQRPRCRWQPTAMRRRITRCWSENDTRPNTRWAARCSAAHSPFPLPFPLAVSTRRFTAVASTAVSTARCENAELRVRLTGWSRS